MIPAMTRLFLPPLNHSMPFTLRRSRRKGLPPSRSLVDVVKSIYVCDTQTDDFETEKRVRASYRRRNEEYYRPHWIMRLPVELLAHVFVMGAEQDTMLPITVSHVCRDWRYLALRTPALWRRITLDSRLRMWSERIVRARACTLDVEILPQALPITPRIRRHYLDAQTVQLYMHMIAPYLSRLRSLTVSFEHYAPYLWNATLSVCCGFGPKVQAPRLESLSLVHPNNDDPKEFLLFNGHAPLLRSVTLNGIRLTWMPSLFTNLTFLDYTHHGFTRGQDAEIEIFRMLQVCTHLRELRLAFPGQTRKTMQLHLTPLSPKDRIYFEHLRVLTIHVDSADIPSALVILVSRFHFRYLRKMTLSSSAPVLIAPQGRNHFGTHSSMQMPFFSRTRKFLKALPRLPSLTRLELTNAWCRASFVCGILIQHVPKLKLLTLRSPNVDDAFLWSLGEACRGRHHIVYPPPGGMAEVIYTPLRVLEIEGAWVSGEGFIQVVRRMLGGGIMWVGEIWVKDCKAVDSDVVKRAARFGVPVKVLPGVVGLKDKVGSAFVAMGNSAFTWTRRRDR
ncbi:hypothetical protein BDW22DRAFT_655703 [Trametopsis cervina]|nr:hypothetical protein BDW22DRAFT_655703 [Trametopsis cervina]